MSDQQLDLFDPSVGMKPKPTAALFRFPLANRRKTVVRVANTLAGRKTEEGQQGYWIRTIRDLAAELRRHGADQVEVDRQLGEFHRAVSAELARHQSPATGPRGAA